MAHPPKKRIGTLLVESGLISTEQLNEALAAQKEQGGKLVQILISLGYLDARSFVDFLAKQPGVPTIDISRYYISRDLLALVPKEFAIIHEVFPLDRIGDLLTVGMVCPLDSSTVDQLEKLTHLRIKPLLCSPDDLRASIARYYADPEEEVLEWIPLKKTDREVPQDVEAPLRLASVASLVRRLDSLPAIPRITERVREAMANVDMTTYDPSDIGKMASIISGDPALVAKLLGVANSSGYGFPNRVASVEAAVALLGLRETCSIVLSTVVLDMVKASKIFDYERFWRASMLRATLAMAVARECNMVKKPGVFASGLLQDIGRAALAEVAPELYRKIDPSLVGESLIEAEEELLGIAHPEAGYLLTTAWGLPTDITESIRFHHMLEHAVQARELVAITTIARCCATAVLIEQYDEVAFMEACEAPLNTLQIGVRAADRLFKEMKMLLANSPLLER